jgi:hypothetical protein
MRRLDGRTRQGRLARSLERELVDHLDGPDRVTVAHRLLIKATCILALRLQLAAERMAEGDHHARELVAVANGIRLNCVTLGLERPAEVPRGTIFRSSRCRLPLARPAAPGSAWSFWAPRPGLGVSASAGISSTFVRAFAS